MTIDEAIEHLEDEMLREDGAFCDGDHGPSDEAWQRFGAPLFSAIDTLIAEVERYRAIWACRDCFMELYHHGDNAEPCVQHRSES